jgi:hypothetical protein
MELLNYEDLLPTNNHIWDKMTRQYFKVTARVSADHAVGNTA